MNRSHSSLLARWPARSGVIPRKNIANESKPEPEPQPKK